ncbi:MAG: hypothetical protein O9294_18005 [Cytophagales bacterium]|jgi:hypothetical protein|nr:hypothetical protein [Cytophagales bacterium]
MWTELKDDNDIKGLLQMFGYFHDSCLREVHISTREYVDDKLAMHFDNKLTATLLFQRQFGGLTVIELKFEDIGQFNFRPFDTNTDAVIYDATLKKIDNIFYWADFADWELGDNDSIWISGQKLFWRPRPELIGNVNRLSEE